MDYPAHLATLPLSFCLSLKRSISEFVFSSFQTFESSYHNSKAESKRWRVGQSRGSSFYILLSATGPGYHHYMSLSKKLTTSKDQRDLETESMDTIYDFLCKLGMKPHRHLVKIIIFSLYHAIVRPQSLSFTKVIKRTFPKIAKL